MPFSLAKMAAAQNARIVSDGLVDISTLGKSDLLNQPDTLYSTLYANITINTTVFGSAMQLTNSLPNSITITNVRQLRGDMSATATAAFSDVVPSGSTQQYSVTHNIGVPGTAFIDYWAEFTVDYQGQQIVFQYQNGRLRTRGLSDQSLSHPDIGKIPLASVFQRGTPPYSFQTEVANISVAAASVIEDTLVISTTGSGQTGINVVATDTDGTTVSSHLVVTSRLRPSAQPDVVVADEDESITFNVLDNDSDPQSLQLEIASFTSPTNGSLSVVGSGVFEYTPDQDYSGQDEFTYVISNGVANDEALVSITVNPVNDPPAFGSNPPLSAQEGIAYSYTPVTTDPDNASLSLSAIVLPAFLSLVAGTISGTPSQGDVGSHDVTLSVSDGSAAVEQSWTILVQDVQHPPNVVGDTAQLDEDSSVNITVLSNDSDSDGDQLTIIATTDPTNGSVDVLSDGTIQYTPIANFHGVDAFTYTVSDTNGNEATGQVTVVVQSINDPPSQPAMTIPSEGGALLVLGSPSSRVVIAWDASTDVDGDDVTYVWDLFTDSLSTSPIRSIDTRWPFLELDVEYFALVSSELGVFPGERLKLFHTATAHDGTETVRSAYSPFWLERGQTVGTENHEVPVSFEVSSVFPNPAVSRVNLKIGLPEADKLNVRIVNNLGQTVLDQRVQLKAGFHDVAIGIEHIISGVYWIEITSSSSRVARSVVVAR